MLASGPGSPVHDMHQVATGSYVRRFGSIWENDEFVVSATHVLQRYHRVSHGLCRNVLTMNPLFFHVPPGSGHVPQEANPTDNNGVNHHE